MPDEKTESPPVAEAAEQATVEVDPMTMDLDKLREGIDGQSEDAPPPEVTPLTDDELAEMDVPEDASEEPEVPETEEAEGTEEVPEETPQTAEQLDAEELQLRVAEAEARVNQAEMKAQHFESKLGERTGKEGFLEQQIKELRQMMESLRSGAVQPDDYGQPQIPQANGEVAQRLAAIEQQASSTTAYAVGQAILTAGQQFTATHQDYQTDETVQAAVNRKLASMADKVNSIQQAPDPINAGQQTQALLEQAYWQAKQEVLAQKREELDRRRADQAADLKKRKRAASVSSSGGTRATPKRKPPNPMTMPMDKLKAIVNRGGGG